jgi:hypothetical protein
MHHGLVYASIMTDTDGEVYCQGTTPPDTLPGPS